MLDCVRPYNFGCLSRAVSMIWTHHIHWIHVKGASVTSLYTRPSSVSGRSAVLVNKSQQIAKRVLDYHCKIVKLHNGAVNCQGSAYHLHWDAWQSSETKSLLLPAAAFLGFIPLPYLFPSKNKTPALIDERLCGKEFREIRRLIGSYKSTLRNTAMHTSRICIHDHIQSSTVVNQWQINCSGRASTPVITAGW